MAIARVQSTSATTLTSTSAATLVLTFSASTTSGNTVIVGIAAGNNQPVKVTSTHGIFSAVTPQGGDSTTGTAISHIFYATMTGADTVITIGAPTAAGFVGPMAAIAVEYSGALIVPDAIPAPIGASGINAANTGNLANVNANALYIGVISVKMQTANVNTNWAFNNIAPFNIVAQNTTNNNGTATADRAIVYLDAIVSTSSTRGTNVNHGFGTNRYAGLLATFNQIATGGGIRTAGHGGLAA